MKPKYRTFIYALGLADKYYYVGQTKQGLQRPKSHLAPTSINLSAKGQWLQDCRDQKQTVVITILEYCAQPKLNERETYWIKTLLAEGHPLTNTSQVREPEESLPYMVRDIAPEITVPPKRKKEPVETSSDIDKYLPPRTVKKPDLISLWQFTPLR